MHPLEAVLFGIMQGEGWHPGSVSWKNNNPGNLMKSPWAVAHDTFGHAIFSSFIFGWSAALWELWRYFSGKDAGGVGPDSTLGELIAKWIGGDIAKLPSGYVAAVIEAVTRGTHAQVNVETKLRDIWSAASPLPLMVLR